MAMKTDYGVACIWAKILHLNAAKTTVSGQPANVRGCENVREIKQLNFYINTH